MTSTTSTAEQINQLLPWTSRLWKQLNQAEQSASSALFIGKNGLGKSQLALRHTMQLLSDPDVFLGGNHPDLHVIIPEEETTSIAEKVSIEEGSSKEPVPTHTTWCRKCR